MSGRDRQYIWVEKPYRGSFGERCWSQVACVEGRNAARHIGEILQRAGHQVLIRGNNAKYPCT